MLRRYGCLTVSTIPRLAVSVRLNRSALQARQLCREAVASVLAEGLLRRLQAADRVARTTWPGLTQGRDRVGAGFPRAAVMGATSRSAAPGSSRPRTSAA